MYVAMISYESRNTWVKETFHPLNGLLIEKQENYYRNDTH